jgi:Asp-tRNA(Asn)/Glu-tRNA(Gln) amidotransferase C subunit
VEWQLQLVRLSTLEDDAVEAAQEAKELSEVKQFVEVVNSI